MGVGTVGPTCCPGFLLTGAAGGNAAPLLQQSQHNNPGE